jgi:hypothetical protein
MADPVEISISLKDFSGNRKTIVYFADPTLTAAQAQSALDITTPKLDAVTDALIIRASVKLPLIINGTPKTAAIDGNRVREGALLDYSATGTAHPFGLYVPAWKNAGFTGDVVANTGVYATFISDLLNFSNTQAAGLVAYLDGVRTFRK